MADNSRLIEFLRECHLADNREAGIFDLFGPRVTHLHFLSGSDVIADGTLDRVAVSSSWAEPALKSAVVYKRERSLIYAPFLILSRAADVAGRPRAICAPVVWYPIELVKEDLDVGPSMLALPDLSSPRLNFPVLALLAEQQAGRAEQLEAFLARWPDAPFDKSAIYELVIGLCDCIPQLAAESLYRFPEICPETEIRELYAKCRNDQAEPVCECRVAPLFALVENSPDVRGVLFELEALAGEPPESVSAPLRSLLSNRETGSARKVRAQPRNVPAVLSQPQNRILDLSYVAPLSLVIGPPGTGKTFTVAALALEHVVRGGSVLFAARSEQALDVIGDKLEQMLGCPGFLVRGGRKDYLRDLKEFLADLLRGAIPLPEFTKKEARDVRARLRKMNRAVRQAERRIERMIKAEASLSEIRIAGPQLGWLDRAKSACFQWILFRKGPIWQEAARYQRLLQERIGVQALFLQVRLRSRLDDMLQSHREECLEFLGALKARTSSRQERYFNDLDMDVLLRAFPIWLVDLSGLHRVLPLRRGLFDLVVVDEATHCDLASCLPALQRGRRAVVTGDPRQLRHISFLSNSRQHAIADRLSLDETAAVCFDYRNKSLLDRTEEVVTPSGHLALLDEHFRSRPPLIDFSNRHFYRGALKIMTGAPGRDESICLEVRRVHGERTRAGSNAVEAAAVVDELSAVLEAEATLPAGLAHSIGILSPFREQVEEIQRQVFRRVPISAIEKHRLRLGTPYGFQGEERDIILLSLAIDRQAGGSTVRYLNRPDVFNVAITRARVRQLVFCSTEVEEIAPGSLLRLYLETAGQNPPSVSAPDGPDVFAQEVCQRLAGRNCQVYRSYPVAGLKLDLVAVNDGRALGIDLIGSTGPLAPAFPLERCRMLQRAGLPVFPLPYSAWLKDPGACVEAIMWSLTGKGREPGA